MNDTLLSVRGLKIHYPVKSKNALLAQVSYVKAVDGVDFDVSRGETFGLVGESGCGKTTTGRAIIRLVEATQGEISFAGKNIRDYDRRALSRHIQIIFQDPFSSLDPRMTVGRCIEEPLLVHGQKNKAQRQERSLQLMADVGLSPEQYTRFPHEFSGGQRQRIGVARAIALHPDLIICDEPVSALDVSIQAQILNLLRELQAKYRLTYVFISHNLAVVKHLCDRIAVMYLGHIVELADKDQLFDRPLHPYTRALLGSIPVPDPEVSSLRQELAGDVPSPANPPPGCCFHTRCPQVMDICRSVAPPTVRMDDGHCVTCHLYDKTARGGEKHGETGFGAGI